MNENTRLKELITELYEKWRYYNQQIDEENDYILRAEIKRDAYATMQWEIEKILDKYGTFVVAGFVPEGKSLLEEEPPSDETGGKP